MAQQTINVGASPNDGTGTPLRTAFQYTNSNFSELYTAVGPSGNNIVVPGNATITGNLTVDTNVLKVDTLNNRVGIGTASPALPFVVSNAGAQGFEINPTGSIVSGGIDILSYNRSTSLYKGMGFGAESYLFRIGTSFLSDAMTLNSTGLGVGLSPSYQIHARKDQAAFTTVAIDNQNAIAAGTGTQFLLIDGGVNAGWFRRNRDGSGNTDIGYKDALRFRGQIAGTERTDMTLDASGNLLVKKTAVGATTLGAQIQSNGSIASAMAESTDAALNLLVYSTGAAASRFYVGMGGTVFATNTTISAISDARLKENVQDIDVGLGAILALKPRKFDWKAGKGKDIKGDRGFIAQEFETVFPNLIDEWKDAAPEGEAPYKSVRQDLIPVLVKAIQELTARVQTLETR